MGLKRRFKPEGAPGKAVAASRSRNHHWGSRYQGAYDKAVYMLKHIGARLLFWGVKIKPGAHSGAAICNTKFISPVRKPRSLCRGYHLLAAPVLRALQGLNPHYRRLPGIMLEFFSQKDSHPAISTRICGKQRWKMASNYSAGTEVKYAPGSAQVKRASTCHRPPSCGERSKFIHYPPLIVICRVGKII